VVTPPAPALYLGHLVHVRRVPELRVFRHRIALWFVDPDDLPVLPWWLRPFSGFHAADHLGVPWRSIRSNVVAWLADRDIDLEGGRVVMLTSARVLGYTFNPLTVYWCYLPDGALRCVIAEVSNTYGEQHCYLLRTGPKPDGTDDVVQDVPKEFRVSPFFAVGGHYRMRLPVPGPHLSLAVALLDGHTTLLTAVLKGRRCPVEPGRVLRLVLTGYLTPQRVTTLIRAHGLRLWLRRDQLCQRKESS
jgi:DUF1365 family protein